MKHFTLPRFWAHYNRLPKEIRTNADKNFQLLRSDPDHPSLHFKQIGNKGLWSVRVGLSYRALGRETTDGIVWFWIGSHSAYDKLISD